MNGVQWETAVLGLTLPEPSPAALTESSRPSFDDHLQQARRQEDRSLRPDAPPEGDNRPDEPAEISQQPPVGESTQRETTEDSSANDAPPAKSKNEEAESLHEDVAAESDIPAAELAQGLVPANQVHVIVCSAEADIVPMCVTGVPQNHAVKLEAAGEGVAEEQGPIDDGSAVAKPGAVDETPAALPHRYAPLAIEQKPAKIEAQQESAPTSEATASEGAAGAESQATTNDSGAGDREPRGQTPMNPLALPAVSAVAIETMTAGGAETNDVASKVSPSVEAVPGGHEPSEAAVQRAETSTPVTAAGDGASTKAPSFLLPGRGTQRAPGAQQLSDADRARLVQRVARALETAGESGQMRLRLSPPELGSLRLDVSVRHGILTAHVEAETPQARMLLLDNLPALRERLQEQNVKIERFDVDLMNQPSGGEPQGYRQKEQGYPDEPYYQGDQRLVPEAAGEPRPTIARRLSGGEQLNVVI